MLPGDLLRYTVRAGAALPLYLKGDRTHWAEKVLQIIDTHRSKTRGDLAEALRSLEGDSPDYYLIRGLAHIAINEAIFKPVLELDIAQLRSEAFSLANEKGHGTQQTETIMQELANRYQVDVKSIRAALYADLPEQHILISVPELDPMVLVDRYNLAQAQGLLYYAHWLVINAHRNVPGEYRRLFHRLKLFGLMYAVEGNLEDGYRVHVDGPASIFRQTRKYGMGMAAFLPALLQVTKWQMEAELDLKGRQTNYILTSESPLKSHYPKPPVYDSILEASFVERWNSLDTLWRLEREVEIIDLKGTVFVPDFALRHPDGRTAHVELVGFWHPDYLKRKFDKTRKAGMHNLLLAVSDRLNVTEEHLQGLVGPVIFFKGKLEPKAVLTAIEEMKL